MFVDSYGSSFKEMSDELSPSRKETLDFLWNEVSRKKEFEDLAREAGFTEDEINVYEMI